MSLLRWIFITLALCSSPWLGSCGSDADDLGVGAECTSNEECVLVDDMTMQCLTTFKGGYCGLSGCEMDAECPTDSRCVVGEGDGNYCFRTCIDKSDCNANRSAENEANCTSSVTLVEGGTEKVCVPPSAG